LFFSYPANEACESEKFFYNAAVTGFLRFIGLLNAAVWLGAAISFTVALGPAFFSNEMKAIIPAPYNGYAAQVVIHRFFLLSFWCSGIAFAHFFLEKLYLGKRAERIVVIALVVMIGLTLIGGIFFQPRLRALHLQKYDKRATTEQRDAASRSFGILHGISQGMNLLVIGGLLIYFFRFSASSSSPRFTSMQKFRS
jgi:hypothetical protein